MIGQTVFHHRIVEKLGGGGMGEVYRTGCADLSRLVPIKVSAREFTHGFRQSDDFAPETKPRLRKGMHRR